MTSIEWTHVRSRGVASIMMFRHGWAFQEVKVTGAFLYDDCAKAIQTCREECQEILDKKLSSQTKYKDTDEDWIITVGEENTSDILHLMFQKTTH